MQFLYPNVLLLMLLPIILLIFLLNTKKSAVQNYFNEEILNKISAQNKGLSKVTRNYLFFIALILLTLSLARPVMNEKEQNISQETIPIVVAIDISKSMLAQDIYPNRLSLAKKKLQRLIQYSKNNSLGVILFAKSSFILSPITKDFNSLNYLVENLDTGLNFDGGSNVMSMLETSKKLLKEYSSKNLIVLSDGGNKEDYSQEITYAKENKIKVYSIALATDKASAIKLKEGYLTDNKGQIVTVKLNEHIKELSTKSGGGYINYSLNDSDIQQILNDINAQAQKEKTTLTKYKTYTELFYYPIIFAIVLLFFAFSSFPSFKKGIPLLLILLFSTPTQKLYASILDFQTLNEAKKSYENKAYKKASEDYEKVVSNSEGFYNLGNAYYKQGNYKKALENYDKVITQDKAFEAKRLHNLGNTYVKLNDLNSAKKMYEKALKLNNDPQTKENLDLVNEALKKQEKKQNEENPKQNQENKNQEKNNNSQNKQDQNKQQNQESQENKQKNQKNKESQNDSKNTQENQEKSEEGKKESKPKEEQKASAKNQTIKEDELSNLEEKKWMDILQKNRTKTFLRKVKNKSDEESSSTPW
ncbi:MAG: tetratricopeptide repeat protein [Candidatus Marinarcus sp.]|uniref:tetratricopeptide repeat protein n=1 Tax=Candidatus Marinarcus sp. TaxID=3100987 RepID=UPI003AFFD9EB